MFMAFDLSQTSSRVAMTKSASKGTRIFPSPFSIFRFFILSVRTSRRWLAALNEPTKQLVWKRNRNLHSSSLLDMLQRCCPVPLHRKQSQSDPRFIAPDCELAHTEQVCLNTLIATRDISAQPYGPQIISDLSPLCWHLHQQWLSSTSFYFTATSNPPEFPVSTEIS